MLILMRGNYQLKGGNIEVSPEWIGFAIPEENYKDYLTRQFNKEIDKKIGLLKNKNVEDIFTRLDSGVIEKQYHDCIFHKEKEYLRWVTWDNDMKDEPFPFMKNNTCREVQAALGLDERYTHNVRLVFINVVKLNNKVTRLLFRPTFCDADFGENFRPAPLGFDKHGLSWPLGEKYSEEEHLKRGRPEAVVQNKHIVLGATEKMILLEND
jgi:hypothetical protein